MRAGSIWKVTGDMLLMAAIALTVWLAASSLAFAWNATNARNWAAAHFDELWTASHPSYPGAVAMDGCTSYCSRAWNEGGGLAKDFSSPGQWYWQIDYGLLVYDFSYSWTEGGHMRNYFRDYTPAGLTYQYNGVYYGSNSPPNYNSSLHYADVLCYDTDGYGDNGGSFDFDHQGMEVVNNGTSTFGSPPPTGTLKVDHNPYRTSNLWNLADRYTQAQRNNDRYFAFRVVN
jgi:hypothetical protein